MTDIALSMEHVCKKFSRAPRHDSLRDLIPAAARGLLGRRADAGALGDQEFWALHDVGFQVGRGEALGIIGGNGAGKSTILKLLSGLMRPTSGEVRVRGRLSALIEVGAGFHQDLSGRENVFLNGVILGMSRAEIRRKFDAIVDFSGIGDFIDMPVKRYSSGMYARLGFSVAVHMEPDILLVDEVLSVGDYAFQVKCVRRMREVLRSGATIIFVSHNLRAMADMCPRALLLSRGRVVEEGPTSQVIRTHLGEAGTRRPDDPGASLRIESVEVLSDGRPRSDFPAGAQVQVLVRIRARRAVRGLACVLYLKDEQFYDAFDTSSVRLGGAAVDLAAGETHDFRFALELHLATGQFHFCAEVKVAASGEICDAIEPAATVFINSPADVRGVANLYPRLL